jgi:hypothetical protein
MAHASSGASSTGSCSTGTRCGAVAFRHLLVGAPLIVVQEVVDMLDVKLFLRVPRDTLRQRREERSGYATAGMCPALCGRARRQP